MRKLFLALSLAFLSTSATAQQAMSGSEIIEKINDRDDGPHIVRNFSIELTDRSGNVRTEKTIAYRRYFGDEKRTIIFYIEPNRVRGTGFLTFDYADPGKDDDQWLYLPALRKVRRISASDRGDYFLGTDFTYEEIKKEQKVELADYRFRTMEPESLNGRQLLVVEGIPINETIARELGVSRVIWRVDPEIWMSRQTDYFDVNGNHARTIELQGVEVIDGYLTTTQMFVQNHKTGHSSLIKFENSDYQTEVSESIFSQARLRRGL